MCDAMIRARAIPIARRMYRGNCLENYYIYSVMCAHLNLFDNAHASKSNAPKIWVRGRGFGWKINKQTPYIRDEQGEKKMWMRPSMSSQFQICGECKIFAGHSMIEEVSTVISSNATNHSNVACAHRYMYIYNMCA